MTTASERYSALRKGQKMPPPPTSDSANNTLISEAIPTALLHSAYAVRGRAFSCIYAKEISLQPYVFRAATKKVLNVLRNA